MGVGAGGTVLEQQYVTCRLCATKTNEVSFKETITGRKLQHVARLNVVHHLDLKAMHCIHTKMFAVILNYNAALRYVVDVIWSVAQQ